MQNVMIMFKRVHTILFLVLISFSMLFYYSCANARSYSCKSDGAYKQKSSKKNRSNYGIKYGYKQNSPRKDYVIKNRKR